MRRHGDIWHRGNGDDQLDVKLDGHGHDQLDGYGDEHDPLCVR